MMMNWQKKSSLPEKGNKSGGSASASATQIPAETPQTHTTVKALSRGITVHEFNTKMNGTFENLPGTGESLYEIIWIKDGNGYASIDFTKHEFTGPCLLLVRPGNAFQFSDCSTLSGLTIQVSESFLTHSSELGNFMTRYCVFDDVNGKSFVGLPPQTNEEFVALFKELLKAHATTDSIDSEIEGYFLRIILLKIYQLKYRTAECTPQLNIHRERYQAFKALVEEKFRIQHDVSFYINALNTTEKTLRNSTNLMTGRSPSTLIQERLILEARRELHHTSKSIKEIALDLGFDDPSYFTRLFSKKLGASPNTFRIQGHGIS